MEEVLNTHRQAIDSLDNQLLQLLNERMEHVKAIGNLKMANKAIIYRPEREKDIVDRLTALSNGLLTRPAIEAIFLEIFATSRNLELPEKVIYLGPEGSFSHQAAESRFGAMSEYLSASNLRAVFEAVDTERYRFGIVPIENNQEGPVTETFDLLFDFDVKIAAEIPMPLNYSLASMSEVTHEIKTIYGTDRAFRQCRKFLKETFAENVNLVPVNSISRAAQQAIAQPNSAAICSKIAASLNGLPLLFQNIEDSTNNQTRFLILSKHFVNKASANDKTTFVARLKDSPGALVGCLQEFHKAGINLTRVDTRPAREGSQFKHRFLIELDGHINDDRIKAIMARYGTDLHWMGSYVKLC